MCYYRYEYLVENLIEILKEKQRNEGEDQDKYNNTTSNHDASKYMKDAQKMVPKVPKMSGSNLNFPGIPSSLK